MKPKYTNDMAGLSGSPGEYEDTCRNLMLHAYAWFLENPEAKLHTTIRGKPSKDLARLYDVLDGVCENASGGMVSVAINHAKHAVNIGWDAYAEEMRDRFSRENPIAALIQTQESINV